MLSLASYSSGNVCFSGTRWKPSLVISQNRLRCSKRDETSGKNSLSDVVGDHVDKLLTKKENRALLDGLEKASQRVDIVRQQLEDIQRQELEAKQLNDYINLLESRATEIAESQREISEARRMIEEAERSIQSISGDGSEGGEKETERMESLKAALISASGGALAGLPIYLTQVTNPFQLLVLGTVAFLSCALFGVTFRYVVRRDVDDVHLKSGAVAAFAITQGLGKVAVGPPLERTYESFFTHSLDGSVYVAESFLIFASAAVCLDFCFKTRLLFPFPKNKTPPV